VKRAAPPIVWQAGQGALRAAVIARLDGDPAAGAVIQANDRRTLRALDLAPARGPGPAGIDDGTGIDASAPRRIVTKTHHLATGRHRLREALKRRLGGSAAEREWRALEALHAAGLPVPRPLARGRLASGDALIALELVEGTPLREAFAAADPARRGCLVAALASTLERLHGSGLCHGDLHLGNLLVRAERDEIVLLDLQRAKRARGERDRLRDLAGLELSLLRAGWPAASRAAVRERLVRGAAQGDAFGAALRRFAADHVRGRARRDRGPGRGCARVRAGRLRGRVERSVPESELLELIAMASRSPQRRVRRAGRAWIWEGVLAGRAVVVKGHAGAQGLRRLADAVRGTPAARAFVQGTREQRLLARSARPIAHLEERRIGLPGSSWLVLEHVGAVDLDAYSPSTMQEALALAGFVGDWLADLHALGWHHADLKGSNLRLLPSPDDATPPRLWLVDLEDLAGPGRPDDEARLTALAQINASIPDARLDAQARGEALARYCERLPFTRAGLDLEGARQEVLRRSLARDHRYRGEGCAAAAGQRGGGISRP
jgi:tRNA A-37 threonylcarbamoyl transferase component Bud32